MRARPTPEFLERLRTAKATHHTRQAHLPLKEKVARVLELQRIVWPLLKQRRALAPWEHPWNVAP